MKEGRDGEVKRGKEKEAERDRQTDREGPIWHTNVLDLLLNTFPCQIDPSFSFNNIVINHQNYHEITGL